MKKFQQVLLIGCKRPEFTLKQLDQLNNLSRLSIFLSIDRSTRYIENKFKKELLQFSKNINPSNSFEHEIQSEKLGLVKHINKSITRQFESSDSLLILEDDILIQPKGIVSLINGLNSFSRFESFGAIGGFSPLWRNSLIEKVFENRWRLTPYFPVWGWGTVKRVWEPFNVAVNLDLEMEFLKKSTRWNNLSEFQKNVWIGRINKVYRNPEYTWDIQFQIELFKRNLDVYLPLYSLVGNIGYGDFTATNTKDSKPFWIKNSTNKLSNHLQSKTLGKSFNKLFIVLDSLFIGGDAYILQKWIYFRNYLRKLNKR